MAQVLSFFLDFISFAVGDWVFGAISQNMVSKVFLCAYRHGLQMNTAEASLKIQRLIAQLSYCCTSATSGRNRGS